jgi:hypothetical protein
VEAGRPTRTFVSQEADRSEKARCHKSDVHVSGEADGSLAAKKQPRKGNSLPAESLEKRRLTSEIAQQSLLDRTQRWTTRLVVPPMSPECRAYEKRQTVIVSQCAAWSSSSERAECGSPARTDLREGQPGRTVPIAIAYIENRAGSVTGTGVWAMLRCSLRHVDTLAYRRWSFRGPRELAHPRPAPPQLPKPGSPGSINAHPIDRLRPFGRKETSASRSDSGVPMSRNEPDAPKAD